LSLMNIMVPQAGIESLGSARDRPAFRNTKMACHEERSDEWCARRDLNGSTPSLCSVAHHRPTAIFSS